MSLKPKGYRIFEIEHTPKQLVCLKCVNCGANIKSNAVTCEYCKTDYNPLEIRTVNNLAPKETTLDKILRATLSSLVLIQYDNKHIHKP